MKQADTLTTIYSHNMWATIHLFEFCAKLTDEQLAATIPGAFGSIRDTMQHIATSERSYFSRISTGKPYRRPQDAPPMTIPEIIDSIKTSSGGLIEWAPKVQPSDTVQVDWDGTPRDVPKTIILTQVINHADEHREQIKAILTQIGVEPPELMAWTYFDDIE